MEQKSYVVQVDNNGFGGIERTYDNHAEAFSDFRKMNDALNNRKSANLITMKSIETNEVTEEKFEKILYTHTTSAKDTLEYKLNQIKDLMNDIAKMREEHTKYAEEDNGLTIDFNHCLEKGLLNDATPEESHRILHNLHLDVLIRRNSKRTLKAFHQCSAHLNQIKVSVDGALSAIAKHKNQQYIETRNSKLKNDQYAKYLERLKAL